MRHTIEVRLSILSMFGYVEAQIEGVWRGEPLPRICLKLPDFKSPLHFGAYLGVNGGLKYQQNEFNSPTFKKWE